MKTINKLFLIVLTGGLFTLTACSDDIVREPSPVPTDGIQAYLYTDATDLAFLPNDEQSFILNVVRQRTDGAATVHLNSVGEKFTVPATVDFAAGESKKEVKVGFDLEIGTSATVKISIPEEEAYIYGSSNLTVNVIRDYTWGNLGTWTLQSSFFGATGETQVLKAAEVSLYKAVSPYDDGFDLLFKVDGNNVVVDRQPIAASYGSYGTLYVDGSGTFENNVIAVTLRFSVSAGSFGQFEESFGLFAQ